MYEALQAMAHSHTLQAIAISVTIVFLICLYMEARLSVVQIGISDSIDKSQHHGVAWVQNDDGRVVGRQFIVDQPHLIENPNRYQIRDIFKQIKMLGFELDHLEILVGGKVRVYRPNQPRPICTAAL